jgi:UDP-hydrolysing UDP-N-acetyl-D-glucosamine 2-epimerase
MIGRKICVVLTTRGNYAKMKSTLAAATAHPDLDLQLVVGGALLSNDYGDFRSIVSADGFAIEATLDYIVPGNTPATVTESAGRCTQICADLFAELQPDMIVIIADRYESLSLAQAALCMNIRIAHLEGGEVSGSIDERIRHAITKLAHIHLPANSDAADRIYRMGETDDSIHIVGTPSLDVIAMLDLDDMTPVAKELAKRGAGADIDLDKPYLVVSQHPVVTEFDEAGHQFEETVKAVLAVGLPAIWIRPNDDAGAAALEAPLNALYDRVDAPPMQSVGSLRIECYAPLIRHAACLVGNSSSGIREAAFLGVPTVNIGNRQHGRQRGGNVIDVGHDATAIADALRRQITHGPFPADSLYGDGRSGEKIAAILATADPALDKTITY